MTYFKVELVPFGTPNYVLVKQQPKSREEGWQGDSPKYHINEVDAETLSSLCDEFRAEIFKKADKADPN